MLPAVTLHESFSARALENPDQTAVVVGDRQLTYRELDLRSDQLASHLVALGVRRENIVALCVDRSIEMLIGLIAILKAGGAYLPIDPIYPPQHIRFLLEDSHASLLLTTANILSSLPAWEAKAALLDDEDSFPVAKSESLPVVMGHHLAYVIYTSGSTGRPKGVLVEHRNVIKLFEQSESLFRFTRSDVWALFHSISFDFAVWEIWGALLWGGQLMIVPREITGFPEQFADFLRISKITVLNQTPSAFRQLIPVMTGANAQSAYDLRLVILGGEAFDPKLATPWFDCFGDSSPELVNMYGITETTIHVTHKSITRADLLHSTPSPIGVPIEGYEVRLVDSSHDEVGINIPGEVSVAGTGVARGYLGRPALTAERFSPGPDGSRVYLSGDLAIKMENGELGYLVRIDDQVKVRGYRIEPREIEACLASVEDVASVIVQAKDYGNGDQRLLAYFVPELNSIASAARIRALKEEISKKAVASLPNHMVPSSYIPLAAFPLTTNGKIARNALESIRPLDEEESVSDNLQTESISETEQLVLDIWEEVLRKKEIRIDVDFFDLGGTSLALLRILALVNERFDVPLDPGVLADGATIRIIAKSLVGRPKEFS